MLKSTIRRVLCINIEKLGLVKVLGMLESTIGRVLCINIEKLGLVKVLGMLDGVGNNNVIFANVLLESISVEPLPLASIKL